MPITFLYFDLGNVLFTFSHERACSQMASVAGLETEQVARFVLGPKERESLLWRFEHGQVSEDEFFQQFCEKFGVVPDRRALDHAAADMFSPIASSFDLIERLYADGHRLGILSNTNPVHWRFLTDGRFPLLNTHFELHVTSFAARSMKPDREIYDRAIQQAGVPAKDIFFVDDRVENVDGARAVGIDAVRYIGHQQLLCDLLERGVGIPLA